MTRPITFWRGRAFCQIAKSDDGKSYVGFRDGVIIGIADDAASVMRMLLKAPACWGRATPPPAPVPLPDMSNAGFAMIDGICGRKSWTHI